MHRNIKWVQNWDHFDRVHDYGMTSHTRPSSHSPPCRLDHSIHSKIIQTVFHKRQKREKIYVHTFFEHNIVLEFACDGYRGKGSQFLKIKSWLYKVVCDRERFNWKELKIW